jgi:hypothetical protein
MFESGCIRIIALTKIHQGEELTVSYTPLHLPLMERRAMLLKQYFFDPRPTVRPHRQASCSVAIL